MTEDGPAMFGAFSIPSQGVDDLGQRAEATITFLKYTVSLTYRTGGDTQSLGSLELTREELVHISFSTTSPATAGECASR
jgi:hypothetical protein